MVENYFRMALGREEKEVLEDREASLNHYYKGRTLYTDNESWNRFRGAKKEDEGKGFSCRRGAFHENQQQAQEFDLFSSVPLCRI